MKRIVWTAGELFESAVDAGVRIANGETAAEVAEWLDTIKFAKEKWSRQAKWTTYNVNSIIRRRAS